MTTPFSTAWSQSRSQRLRSFLAASADKAAALQDEEPRRLAERERLVTETERAQSNIRRVKRRSFVLLTRVTSIGGAGDRCRALGGIRGLARANGQPGAVPCWNDRPKCRPRRKCRGHADRALMRCRTKQALAYVSACGRLRRRQSARSTAPGANGPRAGVSASFTPSIRATSQVSPSRPTAPAS